jgi:hypothetical protein
MRPALPRPEGKDTMTINTSAISLTLTDIQQTDQTQGVGALAVGGQLLGTGAAGAVGPAGIAFGDSAQISGPGKLFAELQQLQSQNPTKFTQVVSDIATQLQTAAQQATGNQANFLTNLADRFQTVANTGDLSSLRPSHHGHGHHAHATYNAQGQVVPPAAPPADSSSTSAPDLRQIFSNIIQTVTQALGA